MKKGILVAGYGTSYKESGEKALGAIENRIKERFCEYCIYCAFTGRYIMKKRKAQGGDIHSIEEAMIQMEKDGIQELVVQPTYIIDGIENHKMHEEIKRYASRFQKISFGKPLLTNSEDYKELADIINREYIVEQDEILLLMGHGSTHCANVSYSALANTIKQSGYLHIIMGTMKGYPNFEDALRNLERTGKRKVCLVPLMIVAGQHVYKDMVGNKHSWKSQLEQSGYRVRYVMTGLGELKPVQDMFVKHVEQRIKYQ